VVVKGDYCEFPFQLGHCIQAVGAVSFEPYRFNANLIGISVAHSGELPVIQAQFGFLFSELSSSAPHLFPPFLRVLLLSICTAIVRKSLLILVRSIDDLEIILKILELAFRGIIHTYYPSKSLFSTKNTISCLLACEDGIALIPRYDIFARSLRDKFDRAITEKSICGAPISSAIVCIAVAPALDAADHPHFDFTIRIDSIPKTLVEDFVFGFAPDFESDRIKIRIANAQQRLRRITIEDDAEELIATYGRWCERNGGIVAVELVVQLGAAIAAFRSDIEITQFDATMAIYFWEEKIATMNGGDSILAQLPKIQSFCDPEISKIRTTDEDTLFQCWCQQMRKVVDQ
jgi:hypothetical protein